MLTVFRFITSNLHRQRSAGLWFTNIYCWLGLFRNQQIFGKWPLIVDPLGRAAETGCLGHLNDLFGGILVAALGSDSFALRKVNRKLGRANMHRLMARGTKMHLDTAGPMIDFRHVLKMSEIEIGLEFSIDAGQQI